MRSHSLAPVLGGGTVVGRRLDTSRPEDERNAHGPEGRCPPESPLGRPWAPGPMCHRHPLGRGPLQRGGDRWDTSHSRAWLQHWPPLGTRLAGTQQPGVHRASSTASPGGQRNQRCTAAAAGRQRLQGQGCRTMSLHSARACDSSTCLLAHPSRKPGAQPGRSCAWLGLH